MKFTYILKTDLAIAYFPFLDQHSARHKLIDIIRSDAALMADLISTGYKHTLHYLSPRQVEMITEKLGNPWRSN